ncbi:hypothetical protein [Streptomyces sp. Caat 7-52]|uniref:hypothetical protein n=1 Tax=Streptomyces sp. Caat 7-52 TaxID=2949637 RepID=UPI002034B3F1|nr:hypothetical protein [Streptomyces sp. Caat 7-52]
MPRAARAGRPAAYLAAACLAAAGVTACGDRNSCSHTINCGRGNTADQTRVVPTGAPPPSSSPTAGTASASPTPPDDAESSEPPPPPVPEHRYLAQLGAVPGTDSDTEVDATAVVGGTPYDHSVTFVCSTYCNNGPDEKPQSVVSFNLGGRYRTLTLKMAVLDSSPDENETGTFEVYLDTVPQGARHVGFGSPKTQTLNVAGVNRVRLVAYRPGTVPNAAMAGAQLLDTVVPHLAWLNPELHR